MLQAWPAVHLPKRGRLGSRPKVHAGFYKCWRTNGFDEMVRFVSCSRLARGDVCCISSLLGMMHVWVCVWQSS